MKYIIVRQPMTGNLIPIVFPDDLTHLTMVPPPLSTDPKMVNKMRYKPWSAGDCTLDNDWKKVTVSGYSTSLEIGPKKGDEFILWCRA